MHGGQSEGVKAMAGVAFVLGPRGKGGGGVGPKPQRACPAISVSNEMAASRKGG